MSASTISPGTTGAAICLMPSCPHTTNIGLIWKAKQSTWVIPCMGDQPEMPGISRTGQERPCSLKPWRAIASRQSWQRCRSYEREHLQNAFSSGPREFTGAAERKCSGAELWGDALSKEASNWGSGKWPRVLCGPHTAGYPPSFCTQDMTSALGLQMFSLHSHLPHIPNADQGLSKWHLQSPEPPLPCNNSTL